MTETKKRLDALLSRDGLTTLSLPVLVALVKAPPGTPVANVVLLAHQMADQIARNLNAHVAWDERQRMFVFTRAELAQAELVGEAGEESSGEPTGSVGFSAGA